MRKLKIVYMTIRINISFSAGIEADESILCDIFTSCMSMMSARTVPPMGLMMPLHTSVANL